MAEKKTKAPKAEATKEAPKAEASKEASKEASTEKAVEPKDKAEATKAEGSPKNYSRGEGQKAVTQAYKDNWNAIFGKKKR